MVSIIPAERTSLDVIGKMLGEGLQRTLPGAIEKGYERKLGLNALDQAQKEIEQAQGDPYKIAMAFARAGAQNPSLERSLGPLAQTAMARAQVDRAFPSQAGNNQNPIKPASQSISVGGQTPQDNQQRAAGPVVLPQANPSSYATPGPFNIFTNSDIDAESERYAKALNDPTAYGLRQTQLNNLNLAAQQQRKDLEQYALDTGITNKDLSRFMIVGSKFDPRNPVEWMDKTRREFQAVKSNDDKLQKAFIPGIGNALFGTKRDEELKKLGPTVRDQVARGLEDDTREFLAENYLTPTEIEELIHPLTPQKEKALSKLPKGFFPAKESAFNPFENLNKIGINTFGQVNPSKGKLTPKENEFISYEEALERAPEELKIIQNQLSDFFSKNVDPDTSLLVLRQALVDRDYDWRQIGPALRQAVDNGLNLTQRQSTELSDLETQPPYQSLPDIFKDWDRIPNYIRGNK